MTSLVRACAAALLVLMVGCGMYGSLYLKEEPGTASPEVMERPPIAVDDDDDDDEDEDEDEDEDDTAGRQ